MQPTSRAIFLVTPGALLLITGVGSARDPVSVAVCMGSVPGPALLVVMLAGMPRPWGMPLAPGCTAGGIGRRTSLLAVCAPPGKGGAGDG